MSETAKMNPLVSIAAVSVTLVSLVGAGVLTGIIPTKGDKAAAPASPVVATAPVAVAPVAPLAAAPEPAKPVAAPVVAQPPKKTVVAEAPRAAPPAPRPAVQQQPQPQYRAAPTYPAAAPSYPATYDYPPTTAPAPAAYSLAVVAQAPAPAICNTCGRVEAVNVQTVAGEGSGLGAVAGGVAGALLGNQVGRGTGKKVATVAGAAGGAFAGHQVEKYAKSGKRYDVVVRMEDGGTRTFPYEAEPGFSAGQRVRVVEGKLQYN